MLSALASRATARFETGDHYILQLPILSEILARTTRGSDLNEVLSLFDEHSPFVLQSNEPV